MYVPCMHLHAHVFVHHHSRSRHACRGCLVTERHLLVDADLLVAHALYELLPRLQHHQRTAHHALLHSNPSRMLQKATALQASGPCSTARLILVLLAGHASGSRGTASFHSTGTVSTCVGHRTQTPPPTGKPGMRRGIPANVAMKGAANEPHEHQGAAGTLKPRTSMTEQQARRRSSSSGLGASSPVPSSSNSRIALSCRLIWSAGHAHRSAPPPAAQRTRRAAPLSYVPIHSICGTNPARTARAVLGEIAGMV